MRSSSTGQKGFTIIELMISTAVFSTILLVILTAITQIGRMYYKGITTAKTQEVARTVVERIAQEIQFSGASTLPTFSTSPNKAVCIGSSRLIWQIDVPVSSGRHALWVDTSSDCSPSNLDPTGTAVNSIVLNSATPTAAGSSPFGSEMLPNGYRLEALDITGVGALWTVKARVVYGADDLIESVDPGTGATDSTRVPARTVCKGPQVGTQFCSISEITTTVLKRAQ